MRLGELWYRFVRALVRYGFFVLSGGFRVKGLENVPRTGPLIVAANHVSHLDPPAVACSIPRIITFMAKSDLFRVPIFGALIRSLGSFPVQRGEADKEAVRLALRLLEEGKAVLVFPEGTRGDGVSLLPFNRGVAMLAKRSGAAVLPVGIVGTHRKMPRGKSFPGWGRTRVSFGTTMVFEGFESADQGQHARDAFTEELRRRILSLCEAEGLCLRTDASGRSSKTSDPADEATESRSPASA